MLNQITLTLNHMNQHRRLAILVGGELWRRATGIAVLREIKSLQATHGSRPRERGVTSSSNAPSAVFPIS